MSQFCKGLDNINETLPRFIIGELYRPLNSNDPYWKDPWGRIVLLKLKEITDNGYVFKIFGTSTMVSIPEYIVYELIDMGD